MAGLTRPIGRCRCFLLKAGTPAEPIDPGVLLGARVFRALPRSSQFKGCSMLH